MSACPSHLGGHDDGLACTREEGHTPGHRYESSSVSDGHTASEDAAERGRG